MREWRLLADVGGTNARFARSDRGGKIHACRVYEVGRFADFESALRHYLNKTGNAQRCNAAAVGAAGPVVNGEVRLTNTPWRISERALSRLLRGVPVRLVNDLEAAALALPHLGDGDVAPLGGVRERPARPRRMLTLNVGTGFGAAVMIRSGDKWITCPSEAGHMSFGAQDAAELALMTKKDATGFTVEDALSGGGLVSLYQKQCDRLGTAVSAGAAQQVFAGVPGDAAAEETLRLFTMWLGRAARDLTLATAAWDGVFLTGGVVQGWRRAASPRLFRSSFEAAGKIRERLRQTYTGVIKRTDIALLGLARTPVE